jgi:hypothetical protein
MDPLDDALHETHKVVAVGASRAWQRHALGDAGFMLAVTPC